MAEAGSPAPAALPWRKRHPVLSRSLLYGLGVGLAVLLLVLFTQRRDEDAATRLVALQSELDGLGLVLATDPSGTRLLEILDEKYADPGLPVFMRGRALRWRAMAWRARADRAGEDGDTGAESSAWAQAEEALRACQALDLEPAERTALNLEWAEAVLQRKDTAGGRAHLQAAADPADLPQGLMRTLLQAKLGVLEGNQQEALAFVRKRLKDLAAPVDHETESYVGGRKWTALEVAIELANFVTFAGGGPGDGALWQHLREGAPEAYDVHAAAARGLEHLGLRDEALSAWRRAHRIAPDLAASAARQDPLLAEVQARLVRN